jgi:UDP-N-acetylmuramate dehydrogenase
MQVREDEPLARRAWWRVGGPVDRFASVDTPEELAEELRTAPRPHLVLGNGSNLLAPDEGLRGTVIKLGGAFRESDVLGEVTDRNGRPAVRVRAGGGLPNTVLLSRLQALGLGGAGSLAGVPGTVGGAVAMNAGTVLGEIEAVLHAVEGVDPAGTIRTIPRAELPMRYREGGLPPGFIVTAALLDLSRDTFAEEQAAIAHHLARRRATQPLDLPSCGSTFRNPAGDTAGRLIEAAGMKGHRVGGAEISPKHANFIVNLGNATATDVMRCIRAAWEGVRAHAGVTLTPEVHVVGRWDPALWPLLPESGPNGAPAHG